MGKLQNDILEYIICCVGAFAERFSLTNAQAYRYLQRYDGLVYLLKHYNIVHTFSIDDAVEDCARICQRHGGALSGRTEKTEHLSNCIATTSIWAYCRRYYSQADEKD